MIKKRNKNETHKIKKKQRKEDVKLGNMAPKKKHWVRRRKEEYKKKEKKGGKNED